jgi:hypothetical protein
MDKPKSSRRTLERRIDETLSTAVQAETEDMSDLDYPREGEGLPVDYYEGTSTNQSDGGGQQMPTGPLHLQAAESNGAETEDMSDLDFPPQGGGLRVNYFEAPTLNQSSVDSGQHCLTDPPPQQAAPQQAAPQQAAPRQVASGSTESRQLHMMREILRQLLNGQPGGSQFVSPAQASAAHDPIQFPQPPPTDASNQLAASLALQGYLSMTQMYQQWMGQVDMQTRARAVFSQHQNPGVLPAYGATAGLQQQSLGENPSAAFQQSLATALNLLAEVVTNPGYIPTGALPFSGLPFPQQPMPHAAPSSNVAESQPVRNDMDEEAKTAPSNKKKRRYNHEAFPQKLHRLILEAARDNNEHIVCFSEDGTSFHILDTRGFEGILPRYFRHGKIASFKRLLNMYGFERLKGTWNQGTFAHPKFLRDDPAQCKGMERILY